jgi:hypothetical protein
LRFSKLARIGSIQLPIITKEVKIGVPAFLVLKVDTENFLNWYWGPLTTPGIWDTGLQSQKIYENVSKVWPKIRPKINNSAN